MTTRSETSVSWSVRRSRANGSNDRARITGGRHGSGSAAGFACDPIVRQARRTFTEVWDEDTDHYPGRGGDGAVLLVDRLCGRSGARHAGAPDQQDNTTGP